MTRAKIDPAALLGGEQWHVIAGDCGTVLRDLADGAVDHAIGDPPYDEQTHENLMSAAKSTSTTRTTGRRGERPHMVPLDFEALGVADVEWIAGEFCRVARRWALAFCALEMLGDYRRAAGKRYVRGGFWYRPDGTPQFSGDRPAQPGEGVAIMHRAKGRKAWNGGGHKAYWRHGVEHVDRLHPTQKPIGLMLELVEQFTAPGDLVLDPFCGVATTGVACLRLGRRFLGIERDVAYAAIARERLEAESRGLGLAAARSGQRSIFEVPTVGSPA